MINDDIIRQTKTGRWVIRSTARRASIRAAILTAILHTIGATCLLTGALQLYCISLGANDLQLGVINFAIWGGALFHLLGMVLMHRLGKRSILVFWAGIMPAISMAVAVLLPVLGQCTEISSSIILYCLLGAVLMRSATDCIGAAAWFPLLQDNVPARVSGKFFGTFRMYWQTSVLAATLVIAWFMGKDPAWWKFSSIFAVGEICFVAKIFYLRKLIEKPRPDSAKPLQSIWQIISETLSNRQMRYFLGYILIYNIAAFMCLPFWIKYLKVLGYSERYILLATSMISVGAILSLRYWGRLADRFGNRAIFNFSHIGMIVAVACWLLVGQNLFSAVFVFLLYGLWSMFQSANGIAQTRYMFQVVPEDNQSQMVLVNTMLFMSIGLAPLMGGLCLWLLSEVRLETGALQMNRYHLLFIFNAALVAIPHHMHKHFQVHHDSTTFEVFAVVMRPVRDLFGSFLILPTRRNNNRQK